jgi:hypothetical protein
LKKGGVPKPRKATTSKKDETRSVAGETLRNRDIGLLPSRSKVSKPSGITKDKPKTNKATVLPVPRPDLWLDPQYSKNKELGSMVGGPGGNESATSIRGKTRLDMELKDIYESTTGKSITGEISSILNEGLKKKYSKLLLLLQYKNSDYKTFALHTIKFGYVSTFYHEFLVFIGFKTNNFKSYDNLFWSLIKSPGSSVNSFIKQQTRNNNNNRQNQMIPQLNINMRSRSPQSPQANQMIQSTPSKRSQSQSGSQLGSQTMQNSSQNNGGLDLISLLKRISLRQPNNNGIIMVNNTNTNNNVIIENSALNAQIDEITNRFGGINTRTPIEQLDALFGQMELRGIIHR